MVIANVDKSAGADGQFLCEVRSRCALLFLKGCAETPPKYDAFRPGDDLLTCAAVVVATGCDQALGGIPNVGFGKVGDVRRAFETERKQYGAEELLRALHGKGASTKLPFEYYRVAVLAFALEPCFGLAHVDAALASATSMSVVSATGDESAAPAARLSNVRVRDEPTLYNVKLPYFLRAFGCRTTACNRTARTAST
mmetsp:Transcript_12421/g.30495  ORF Transcript_12421/g.30495 Transcript_12421/m.30495 type:complete len:197 (+) Transcript_12421:474-1064(+)